MDKFLKYFCLTACLLIAVAVLFFLSTSPVNAQCSDLGESCSSTGDCCGTSSDLICFPFGTRTCIRPAGWRVCSSVTDCCGVSSCASRHCKGGTCCGRHLEACVSDSECCTSIGWFCRAWSPTNPSLFCKCSHAGCSDWVDGVCGGGSCSSTQIQQTRTGCTYSCASTVQCVNDCTCGNPPSIPTLIAPLNGGWINYNPTFQASATDPEGEQIRILFDITGYGSAWSANPEFVDSGEIAERGPITLDEFSTYWWRAYAEDSCGLISDWSDWSQINVDPDPPTATINYPNGTINYDTFTVTLTESDSLSGIDKGVVDISYDNGATWTNYYANRIANFSFTGANNTCYKFRYEVTDVAGNTSGWVTDPQVCIDTSVPTCIISYPNGWINTTSFNVQLTETDPNGSIASGDVDVRTRAHGGTFGSWINTGLPNNGSTIDDFDFTGQHCNEYQFRYSVTDDAGNVSARAQPGYTTSIDNVRPTATIDYPSGVLDSLSFDITLDESDACSGLANGEVQLSVNGGAWQAHSNTMTSWTATGVNGNCYTFRYRVTDNAGNQSTWSTGNEICIDTSKPTCTISYPNGWINTTDFNVTLTEDDPGGSVAAGNVDVRTRAHGGTFGSWVNTGLPSNGNTIDDFDFTGTHCNEYQFRYSVTDDAGNVSARAQPGYTTSIDNVRPTASINYPSGAIPSLNFDVTLDESDDCSGIRNGEVQISTDNGATWQAHSNTTDNFTFTGTNNDCYTFRYRAEDNAGNWSWRSTGEQVCIDFSIPNCSINYPDGWINNATFNVQLTEDDPGGSIANGDVDIMSRAHGGTWPADWSDHATTIDDFDYTGQHCNEYRFRYQVTDTAGNMCEWSDPGYITSIDANPPTATMDYTGGTVESRWIEVSLDASDDCSGVGRGEIDIKIDNGEWEYYALGWQDFNYYGSYGNTYQFRFRARDRADNWSDWTEGPIVIIESVPTVDSLDLEWRFCPLGLMFAWNYFEPTDLPQSAFQIQIDDNDDFSSLVIDTGEISGSNTQYILTENDVSNLLDGSRYYWRIRVSNSNNTWSEWTTVTDLYLIIYFRFLDNYSSYD